MGENLGRVMLSKHTEWWTWQQFQILTRAEEKRSKMSPFNLAIWRPSQCWWIVVQKVRTTRELCEGKERGQRVCGTSWCHSPFSCCNKWPPLWSGDDAMTLCGVWRGLCNSPKASREKGCGSPTCRSWELRAAQMHSEHVFWQHRARHRAGVPSVLAN